MIQLTTPTLVAILAVNYLILHALIYAVLTCEPPQDEDS